MITLADVAQPGPASTVEVLPCPRVAVQPVDFQAASRSKAIVYRAYDDLRAAYRTFDALRDNKDYPSWDLVMTGHPGFPGGVPFVPMGTGVTFGEKISGAEWWITAAEGLDDSPGWSAVTVDAAGADGMWLDVVRAEGRDITLTGVVLCDTAADCAAAKVAAAAALAVPPRTGILTYARRRLSVALTGRTRVEQKGDLWFEVQMTLRGIDVGSPGGGAFMEGDEGSVVTTLRWGVPETVVLGGGLPSSPQIKVLGPVPNGCVVTVGKVPMAVAPLAAQEVLTIDCRTRRVMLGGKPARAKVTTLAWPRLTVGANVLSAMTTGPPPQGEVRVVAVPLF